MEYTPTFKKFRNSVIASCGTGTMGCVIVFGKNETEANEKFNDAVKAHKAISRFIDFINHYGN